MNFKSPVRIDGFRESLGLQVLVVSSNTGLRKQTLAVVVAIKSTGGTLRNITEMYILYKYYCFEQSLQIIQNTEPTCWFA